MKKMLLAARIDDAIKARGWQKQDLAKALHKRPSEISKWLSGTHNFTTETLWEIEKILGTDLINLQEQDAEDVTQHAFVSALENLDGFREEASFSTWLLRIATYAALKVLRKRKGLPTVSLDEATEHVDQPVQRDGGVPKVLHIPMEMQLHFPDDRGDTQSTAN